VAIGCDTASRIRIVEPTTQSNLRSLSAALLNGSFYAALLAQRVVTRLKLTLTRIELFVTKLVQDVAEIFVILDVLLRDVAASSLH
jgi:hypothetical protein